MQRKIIFLIISAALPFLAHNSHAEDISVAMIYSNPDNSQGVSEFVAHIADYYRQNVWPKLNLIKASEVTQAELNEQLLLLIGPPVGFPLLQEKLHSFPVGFTDNGFDFGGKTYSKFSGLILIQDITGQKFQIHTGATWAGVKTTFSVPTTDNPGYLISSSNKILRDGQFLTSPNGVQIDTSTDKIYADDPYFPRQEFESKMSTYASRNVVYCYQPGSWAGKDIKNFSIQTEKILTRLFGYFNFKGFAQPVKYYLYDALKEKESVSGVSGNANCLWGAQRGWFLFANTREIIENQFLGNCLFRFCNMGLFFYSLQKNLTVKATCKGPGALWAKEGNNKGNVPDLAITATHKPLKLSLLTFSIRNDRDIPQSAFGDRPSDGQGRRHGKDLVLNIRGQPQKVQAADQLKTGDTQFPG